MTKHTPAPWRIETNGPALRYVIKDDCNDSIAQTFGQPEQAADAALIVAAPELLEALKLALKALEAIGEEMTLGERYTIAGQYLLDSLNPARNAIAKAEGSA